MRDDTRPLEARHPKLAVALPLCFAWMCVVVACQDAGNSRDARPPNVVLFVLDAARADHFGVYGYPRDTTPHIDAFAEDATRFTGAIADGSFTFASMSALFTGLPPDRTGLLKARRLGDDLPLLAASAGGAGYRSRGYSENPYVTPTFGFDRGFDAFETALSYSDWKKNTRRFQHSDPAPGVDAMLDFMSVDSDRPFFAYLHLLRPHNPYAPPEPFAGRFGANRGEDGLTAVLFSLDKQRRQIGPKRLDNIRALYDENLAAGDAAFGRLRSGMAERGLLANTVVVVLSDHGEGFLEHGRLLHGSTPFDEMVRVPLLVRVPEGTGRVEDRPVHLAAVGEWLQQVVTGALPASELPRPSDEVLTWAMQHEKRAALRTPSRKLVVDSESFEVVGYYDLEADPREQQSLPLDAEGERMLARTLERVRNGHASLARPPEREIDPEVLEQIRALGYVEE
jgi:membrane-anchored protein YejM (alkaline phosphatase superfamily)